MDIMTQNDMGVGDMSGVQLPDVQQDDEVMWCVHLLQSEWLIKPKRS
jgi:hypothetical protein